jgi:hypothetical protein
MRVVLEGRRAIALGAGRKLTATVRLTDVCSIRRSM